MGHLLQQSYRIVIVKIKKMEFQHQADAPPSYEDVIKNPYHPSAPISSAPTTVQVMQVPSFDLGSKAARMICPNCKHSVTTTTSSKPSMTVWALSAVLCFTMLWPCFCVPFCVDSLHNVKHSCPNCKTVLGLYSGLGMD